MRADGILSLRRSVEATFAVALSLLPISARADDYPTCGKVLVWPDECVVGGYRHYGEIYLSRPVQRGESVSELPRGEQINITSYKVWGFEHPIEQYFENARTTGIIALKDGKIVYERYLLGANEQTLFTSASIAKSITSTLVGFAIGDGLIRSVDDPISDYVPELKGSGYDEVPIKAVLQMSSGVKWVESYGTGDSDMGRLSMESVIENKTPTTEFARNAKPQEKPFSQFNYSGVDPIALGWLVSRVTGKNLATYLSEKLWVPLGMQSDATWLTDGDGPTANETAWAGLNVTLRDYARFGLFMAQNGTWQGKQLLPPTWVKEATRPDGPQVQCGKLYPGYQLGYQYLWWAFPGEEHKFLAQGVRGQFIYVNPARNVVIVVTSAWKKFSDDSLELDTWGVFEAIEAALPD